jgi:hypothetical protein
MPHGDGRCGGPPGSCSAKGFRPHPMEMRGRRRTPVNPSAGEPTFSSPQRELVSPVPGDADISSRPENGIRDTAKAGTSLTIAGLPPSGGREDPLDFLLAVMHDPEAAPRHRVRPLALRRPISTSRPRRRGTWLRTNSVLRSIQRWQKRFGTLGDNRGPRSNRGAPGSAIISKRLNVPMLIEDVIWRTMRSY